jgi:hypothetical protein
MNSCLFRIPAQLGLTLKSNRYGDYEAIPAIDSPIHLIIHFGRSLFLSLSVEMVIFIIAQSFGFEVEFKKKNEKYWKLTLGQAMFVAL